MRGFVFYTRNFALNWKHMKIEQKFKSFWSGTFDIGISGQTNFMIIPLGHSSLTNYLAQGMNGKYVSASFITISFGMDEPDLMECTVPNDSYHFWADLHLEGHV